MVFYLLVNHKFIIHRKLCTRPYIKVLISTGYGTDGEVEEIVRDSQNGLIQKPFKFKEFSSKIEAILSMN
jgi:hypothetical protein